MGVVYKARQRRLNRPVALKMILAGAHATPRELDRFRREAEAVARLQHPNIVQIYEIGEHDGRPYLALEFVEGESLARQIGGVAQPARRAAELVEVLARAIHAAHRIGIIHRDLKPANVLLTDDGRPQDHRLRAGQAARWRGGLPDPDRAVPGHAQLHGAGAGVRSGRRVRPGAAGSGGGDVYAWARSSTRC